MDSFFKAAVCDLDKLLDDFELNTEELECKPVFLKPPAYCLSSLAAEASTIPQCFPDLSSLRYSSAPCFPDQNSGHNCSDPGTSGVKGQSLTGVDLLSSVDRGPTKACVPPCPDRALKPACDLVNDTSPAVPLRADDHDAFSELDMAEKLMEEEGELLVDFSSPVAPPHVEATGWLSLPADDHANTGSQKDPAAAAAAEILELDSQEPVEEYSPSLDLLDVILPAAVETGCESADASPSSTTTATATAMTAESARCQGKEVACGVQQEASCPGHCEQPCALPTSGLRVVTTADRQDAGEASGDAGDAEPSARLDAADGKPAGLSCLPLAASMCGALMNHRGPEDESEQQQAARQESENEASESTEADACLASVGGRLAAPAPGPAPATACLQHGQECHPCQAPPRNAPRFDPVPPSPPDENLAEPPEFGFECLPESDQAELLVTDEELEAFLQTQTEAEQLEAFSRGTRCGGWDQPESLSGLIVNGELGHRLSGEEPRSCGQAPPQGPCESLASPESDRALGASLEESFSPAQDARSSYQVELTGSSRASHSVTSNYIQPQHSGSPPPQASYGGARPKQLYCQTHKSAPSPDEVECAGQPEMSGGSSGGCGGAEDGEDHSDAFHPQTYPQEGHSSNGERLYAPQEHRNACAAYDELSEPPPYPGEPLGDGPKCVDMGGADEEGLGCRQPPWLPDAEAPNCMNCLQKFTFTKRRHHCRACGKVYCAVCCNRKCKLKYLDKEARVCIICFDTIHRAQALEHMMSPTGPSPNPNVPSEYCSTIPPLQQARAAGTLNSPPPTVMVPVSVLKHHSSDGCPREQKRVWFADGILPNGEVADTSKLSSRRSPQEPGVAPDLPASDPASAEVAAEESTVTEACRAVEIVRPPVSGPWDYALLCGIASSKERAASLLPEDEEGLPPLLISTVEDDTGDVVMEQRPEPSQILLLLEEGGPRPLTFVLNANLLVNVKLLTYCSRRCWLFGSNGLQALGQREVVFVLECLPEEKTLPKDLFTLYLNIYQDAQKGRCVEDLGNVTFTCSFLGSKEHGGMVFFSPTCQPLEGLTLPPQPFLFGLLIQRLEVPWAKVFPLRLLLRLGAEHSVYPTTLVSIRFRDSVYRETGHTIMNLLADLRNYQYSLSVVEGLRIHMEMGHSYIDIPKSRFNEMLKVVNASNEHVISVGASFSTEADSHLVCFQNQEGNYQTQANSMPGKTRTVTGASFVVFNGALKASSGFIAKSSIVEDGLMLQIPPETMESLRTALREQTDFHIPCGKSDGGELRENVTVRWVDWCVPVNTGVISQVDGRPLEGVHSVRVQQDTEFECEGRNIRCTEVFYQLKNPDSCLATVLQSCGVFQREMALAACSALVPHLAVLTCTGINSLALRVSTQADMVEYQAGSRSKLLPQRYMNELDSALIPVIHGGCASVPQTAMDMEFSFYITQAI